MVGIMMSCDTDRDDLELTEAEARELNLIASQGQWKISEASYNNVETTANYSSYVFLFEDGNNLTAKSDFESVSGTWRVGNDSGDEFDPYNDLDFHIFFNSAGKLGELANNYDVISATSSQIRLQLGENANGTTARLTFSKN
ncbi:hypothetical protein GCM10023164_24660 [Christiangramia aestuarii]